MDSIDLIQQVIEIVPEMKEEVGKRLQDTEANRLETLRGLYFICGFHSGGPKANAAHLIFEVMGREGVFPQHNAQLIHGSLLKGNVPSGLTLKTYDYYHCNRCDKEVPPDHVQNFS